MIVVAAVVALAMRAAQRTSTQGLLPETASAGLTVAASAAALAAAVLCGIAHRVTNDGRAAWISAGLAVYSLFAIPATAIGSLFESARAITGAARLSAHVIFVLMVLACALKPMSRVKTHWVLLFAAALSVVAGAASLAIIDPQRAITITGNPAVRYTVISIWLLAGLLIVWRTLTLRLMSGFRLGLGIVLMALAHGYRIGHEAPQPDDLPGLTFLAVRLIAVLLVLVGAAQFVWWTFSGTGQAAADEPQQPAADESKPYNLRRLETTRPIRYAADRTAK